QAMAKKKNKQIIRPWCWYCEREFEDEKVLMQHQKAKHFKCNMCPRRLNTAGGLAVHIQQVHKLEPENLPRIENALPGRDGYEVEIFGMEGIPAPDVADYKRRKEIELGLNPGTISQPPSKRPKLENRPLTEEELRAQLAAHKALMGGSDASANVPTSMVPASLCGTSNAHDVAARNVASRNAPRCAPFHPWSVTPWFPRTTSIPLSRHAGYAAGSPASRIPHASLPRNASSGDGTPRFPSRRASALSSSIPAAWYCSAARCSTTRVLSYSRRNATQSINDAWPSCAFRFTAAAIWTSRASRPPIPPPPASASPPSAPPSAPTFVPASTVSAPAPPAQPAEIPPLSLPNPSLAQTNPPFKKATDLKWSDPNFSVDEKRSRLPKYYCAAHTTPAEKVDGQGTPAHEESRGKKRARAEDFL
ncbi:hypothetical protein A0H81_10885, partial [Grifola frondosa]